MHQFGFEPEGRFPMSRMIGAPGPANGDDRAADAHRAVAPKLEPRTIGPALGRLGQRDARRLPCPLERADDPGIEAPGRGAPGAVGEHERAAEDGRDGNEGSGAGRLIEDRQRRVGREARERVLREPELVADVRPGPSREVRVARRRDQPEPRAHRPASERLVHSPR